MDEEPLNIYFTHAWINDGSAIWPEAVDYRIWKYMIYADYYFPRKEDIRGHSLASLQKRLTRGTRLEGCSPSSDVFINFDKRLYSRINILSSALESKSIITFTSSAKWSKTPAFDVVWNEHVGNGNKFWATRHPVEKDSITIDRPERIRRQVSVKDIEQDSDSEFEPSPTNSTLDKDGFVDIPITGAITRRLRRTMSKTPIAQLMNTVSTCQKTRFYKSD